MQSLKARTKSLNLIMKVTQNKRRDSDRTGVTWSEEQEKQEIIFSAAFQVDWGGESRRSVKEWGLIPRILAANQKIT